MDIRKMHVTFRELAQQIGMQTVRAILNEDIDICINNAIIDKVREILLQNVGPVNYADKVIRQNAIIAPINAIRTLYCKGQVEAIDITSKNKQNIANEVYPWNVVINSSQAGTGSDKVMLYTGFKVSYDYTSLYDCRIIEAEDLGQTLRDFCNRATPDAPIATVLGDSESITVDLYTGRTTNTWDKVSSFVKPVLMQYLYIKEPAEVKYSMDGESDVNCDLPPYLHPEIVERAVGKYLASIGVGMQQESKQ